ncbi:hypothetical protein Sta7437_1896 [Stanieria cyanosphaera PCC 7437]|uniref:DZANK-type domain-containing protein n=2 Tax=Stanieria cyanosphaera TaxID=102116 RepID=K9XUV9_STAC7|nr:hypothetical protein Sta7437_1896 [Stanieria cyanosphaera PCC 7437]
MFSFIKKIARKLIRKSTYIHHESLNKVSLVILILIDIFVLFNVFSGLNNISQWIFNPSEEIPCFSTIENYYTATNKESFALKAATIENLINHNNFSHFNNQNKLGKVSKLCDNYLRLEKEINTPDNIEIKADIEQIRTEISNLNQEIQTLQSQYDSTLLEKIAGQTPQNSINQTTADQIKSEIDTKTNQISNKKQQILQKQTRLIQVPAADAYLKLLNNTSEYKQIKKAYQSAQFWYPNKQLLLQTLFLLPLIIGAYFWHKNATIKNQGLQALLSWHLLLIFCIPLLIKVFEFIQFGNLIRIAIESIVTLLGGLLFVSNYVLILIIPLLGFGLIKFLQRFVFNQRIQAKKRIEKIRCINCNSQLRLNDRFCHYCGFNQYTNCPNCNQKTYKLTNFCRVCGHQLEQN